MRRMSGGLPPRYGSLLRLSLAAALVRLAALAPFFLTYFLPVGSWFRLILLGCPALWIAWVCPARVRYAGLLFAFVKDESSPLRARDLLARDASWRAVCRGRIRLMRPWMLPMCALLLFMLPLFLFLHAFSAVNILLGVFGGVATVIGAMANFISRLLMGESPVQQAGILGGISVLAAVLAVCLGLFGLGVFRSSAYRFGFTAMLPKFAAMKPLFKQNLLLWVPTLALACVLALFSYGELGLLLSNLIGAAPGFSVKLQIHQTALLALTAVSYLLLLPLRKLNTAKWAQSHASNEE